MDKQPLSVKTVFDRVLEIEPAAERKVYLDKACVDAPEIRQQVEALLKAYENAGSFLEKPAPDLGATVDSQPGDEAVAALAGTKSAGPHFTSDGPGRVIGPYKLLQQIGEGGMGTVFLAEQSRPVQRMVALKIIKDGMDSRQVIARFEAERQALALMDHPNIARVLDAGTTDAGRPYFLTINGAGVGNTVIDGGGQDRVFQVLNGPVTLAGMTIQGGNAMTGGTGQDRGRGGAIYNSLGSLTINDSLITGGSAYYGGAIDNYQGTLTINNSVLSANSASFGGGISSYGSLTINNSTLSANSASSQGGGIWCRGTTTVNASTLAANSAGYSGGGIYNYPGTLIITNCILSGNVAQHAYGGGVWNYGTLTVSNSTFSNNSAAGAGGGISNNGTLTVSGSTFTGNSARVGGGIWNYGTLTIDSSTITGNTAIVQGGGIFNNGKLTIRGSRALNNFAPVGADLSYLGTLSLSSDSTIGITAP